MYRLRLHGTRTVTIDTCGGDNAFDTILMVFAAGQITLDSQVLLTNVRTRA